MKKRILLVTAVLLFACTVCGCTNVLEQPSTGPEDQSTQSTQPAVQADEVMQYGYIAAAADKQYVFADNCPVFSLDNTFYSCPILVELKTREPAEIYYTMDGSEPDKNDRLFDPDDAIYIVPQTGDFPKAITIKARAYYPDGTYSAPVARTYFCGENVEGRFTTAVFAISGEASVLTEGPDGIFYGDNAYERGDDTEREVFLEGWDSSGNRMLAQYCGIRIYGGASRGLSIKSTKLYARKSYSSGIGKFHTDIFGTTDLQGNSLTEYDKLVLRNAGNDFQFGFIRDELCQTLAMQAGFTDYEAVIPAVVYLNGEYYGFFWLHETYCDDYFKDKYPNENAAGEFVIAEGNDRHKSEEEDGGKEVYAEAYNTLYETYAYADLTNEDTYAELCKYIDVENYLRYFAFNIYINNADWPQNNYKCYRYVPAEGETLDGVYDGRWRYLLHDTDFSMGLYGSDETVADYDNIGKILDPDSNRYAPLFASLMHRQDCRAYFMDQLTELAEGVLSSENVTKTLYELHTLRCTEQDYMYQHMKNLREKGDDSFWSSSYTLAENMDMIRSFANKRYDCLLGYAQAALEKYE